MAPRTIPPGAGAGASGAPHLPGAATTAMVDSMPRFARKSLTLLSLLSLPVALVVLSGGTASARVATTTSTVKTTSTVRSTSLGRVSPTFTGPAATGCASGCSLLTGPFPSPSTANLPASSPAATAAAKQAAAAAAAAAAADAHHAMPSPVAPRVNASGGADPPAPTVSCQPLGLGCDPISLSSGGSVGVKGLNAVDS